MEGHNELEDTALSPLPTGDVPLASMDDLDEPAGADVALDPVDAGVAAAPLPDGQAHLNGGLSMREIEAAERAMYGDPTLLRSANDRRYPTHNRLNPEPLAAGVGSYDMPSTTSSRPGPNHLINTAHADADLVEQAAIVLEGGAHDDWPTIGTPKITVHDGGTESEAVLWRDDPSDRFLSETTTRNDRQPGARTMVTANWVAQALEGEEGRAVATAHGFPAGFYVTRPLAVRSEVDEHGDRIETILHEKPVGLDHQMPEGPQREALAADVADLLIASGLTPPMVPGEKDDLRSDGFFVQVVSHSRRYDVIPPTHPMMHHGEVCRVDQRLIPTRLDGTYRQTVLPGEAVSARGGYYSTSPKLMADVERGVAVVLWSPQQEEGLMVHFRPGEQVVPHGEQLAQAFSSLPEFNSAGTMAHIVSPQTNAGENLSRELFTRQLASQIRGMSSIRSIRVVTPEGPVRLSIDTHQGAVRAIDQATGKPVYERTTKVPRRSTN